MASLSIAACQINPVVGDISYNVAKMEDLALRARDRGASLAVFPELAVSGYPPEDLLAKSSYLHSCSEGLQKLAESVDGITMVVGTVEFDGLLYNSAAVIDGGRTVRYVRKEILPNYLVFDEKRYFTPGNGPPIVFLKSGVAFGISICEDAWFTYGPVSKLSRAGVEFVININASPYSIGKRQERAEMLRRRSSQNEVEILYLNQVGGQDELVFDGASMLYGRSGELEALADSCREEIIYINYGSVDGTVITRNELVGADVVELSGASGVLCDEMIERLDAPLFPGGGDDCTDPRELARRFSPQEWTKEPFMALSTVIEDSMVEETYRALLLGTRDYVEKNGFSEVVLGLSGGIDSALVATIACDALGPRRVHCVAMPSRYSSEGSVADAKQLSENLGVDFIEVSIEKAHRSYLETSQEMLGGRFEGVTEENLQSRLRGVLLMALSNRHGWLVLTTGNKSELAVGYSTLYGDTAGGFAVIKDLSKTMVYRLARFRNTLGATPVIPDEILTKPPSAELRPDQKDVDSLPPYEILDPVIEALVELDHDVSELVAAGFDADTVMRIARLIDVNEYKRRQNPPGVRVTQRAFGKDRRVPITSGYRPWETENGNDFG